MLPIDYTDKDYNALRRAMLDLARYRLPEWTDRSDADLGMLFIDLFAYMGDIILYYQDRIANESFLPTASERRSVMHLLRLIGYELKPPIAAYADLSLTFNAPDPAESGLVVIPYGTPFATKDGIRFEYLGPTLEIDVNSSEVIVLADGRRLYEHLPVRHSIRAVDEILGSSNGAPNQAFRLARAPLIPESLSVQVNEGGTWLEWQQQDNFLYHSDPSGQVIVSTSESRRYTTQTDERSNTFIFFGDGVYSRIPPIGNNNIRASYRAGGGLVGNVPAGAITEPQTPIVLLDTVTNPRPAAGGTDQETTEHAARFGPLAFRSGERAVTLNDFVALAHQAGGVAKVKAQIQSWNQIDLYVAPEGETATTPPESLKQRLIAFFEHKRMVGTFVTIQDPVLVPIDIMLEVVAAHHYTIEHVRQSVENAVHSLLAFQNVDFGHHLYLSKVYEALEALPGIYAVTVTRFSRHDNDLAAFEADLAALESLGITTIPESVRRAVRFGISAEGRIDIGDYEIPVLGMLAVTVKELHT